MALDRFKQALAALLDQAPDDPLERDEFFELNTLPAAGGSGFEVVICDEEHEIFAVITPTGCSKRGKPARRRWRPWCRRY